MDSFLKPMSDAYPKCFIDKQASPSYVRIFTSKDEDIILVYIKNRPSSGFSVRSNIVNDEKEELELTGSPLKLDLSLHTILDETLPSDEPQMWSKEEGSHQPVPLKQAREIANLYTHSLRENSTQEDAVPMWILCCPTDEQRTLLLTTQSYKDHFVRGIVSYEGTYCFEDINVDELVEKFAEQEKIGLDMVQIRLDSKHILSASQNAGHSADELVNGGRCGASLLSSSDKDTSTLFEQEVIIGHLSSPCNSIWQSICSLHNINQLLVDMTVAGFTAVNLESAQIRHYVIGSKRLNNSKRLSSLLTEVETYAYMAQCPPGGCTCVTDDTSSLKMSLNALDSEGSSNDFTYKLWDILKDCDTAEELISLLLQALKFISSGKIRPFIDANNKTYLSKLVLKLSRGHSQSAKVLTNLRSNPPQVLSMVAQVGIEKAMWEYTHIMSLVQHSFYIAGIWTSDGRSHESIEQINQTIQDMTMSGGDFSLNPFESLSNAGEHSIRLDCESFYEDDPNELTVDDFASLKKHGLGTDKKSSNEVPIIADEIDISPWKNLLMKFAQVHVCLEHLYWAETNLRADFACLKPIASSLLEQYVSDRSPVKTVGQLMNEPIQRICLPLTNAVVKDHLKKPVFWYRVSLSRKVDAKEVGMRRDMKMAFLFTQQPVFPSAVWQHIEPQNEDVAEITTVGEDLKYYSTKYTYLNNKLPNKLPI